METQVKIIHAERMNGAAALDPIGADLLLAHFASGHLDGLTHLLAAVDEHGGNVLRLEAVFECSHTQAQFHQVVKVISDAVA